MKHGGFNQENCDLTMKNGGFYKENGISWGFYSPKWQMVI